MCHGYLLAGFVINSCPQLFRQKVGYVLNQRTGAVDVEALQTVADAENGLAHIVGVLQQEFVDGVAARVGGCSVGRARGAELGRVDVGVAAGQKHAIAALDEPHDLGGSLIEGNADRYASGLLDRLLVLGDGALGVIAVGGVRHGNGYARRHRSIVALTSGSLPAPANGTLASLARHRGACPHTPCWLDSCGGCPHISLLGERLSA